VNYYLDSSVIVDSLVNPQATPPWTPGDELCGSAIVSPETRRALLRLRNERHISGGKLAEALAALLTFEAGVDLADVSAIVLDRAGQAFAVHVRTLDAIHLATALLFRERRPPDLVFATHDRRLGIAAATLGFSVLPPVV